MSDPIAAPRAARSRLVTGFLVLSLVLGPSLLSAGQGWADYGKTAVARGTPTSAGQWDGSWVYVSRDDRFALFMRTVGGKPEAKLQYQSLAHPEAFETDWNGKSTYYLAGHTAIFDLAITSRTKDRIEGTWNWQVEFADSGRSETGKFKMYRIDNGRKLMIAFDSFERQIRRGTELQRFPSTPAIGFTKASKRVVLWDELPF